MFQSINFLHMLVTAEFKIHFFLFSVVKSFKLKINNVFDVFFAFFNQENVILCDSR